MMVPDRLMILIMIIMIMMMIMKFFSNMIFYGVVMCNRISAFATHLNVLFFNIIKACSSYEKSLNIYT
jgi:hypothetical protein